MIIFTCPDCDKVTKEGYDLRPTGIIDGLADLIAGGGGNAYHSKVCYNCKEKRIERELERRERALEILKQEKALREETQDG